MDADLKKAVEELFPDDEGKMMAWINKEGLGTMEEFGLLAADEKEVSVTILPGAKTGGVDIAKMLTVARIKKLWATCRKASQGMVMVSKSEDGESAEPLDDRTWKSCEVAWARNHKFSPSAGRLLVLTQLNPMYAMSHADKRDFSLLPIRRMRLQDSSLNDVKEDNLHTMYLKLRAFWYSMAMVCQDIPEFFDLQEAEDINDRLLGYLHKKHATRPPYTFFIEAWENTARVFQSAVRSKKLLKDVTAAESSYQHFWTVFVPESSPPSTPTGTGPGTGKGKQGKGKGKDGNNKGNNQWISPASSAQQDTYTRLQRTKDREIAALRKQLDDAKQGSASKKGRWERY